MKQGALILTSLGFLALIVGFLSIWWIGLTFFVVVLMDILLLSLCQISGWMSKLEEEEEWARRRIFL